jgi:hypothetical protein
MLGYQLEHRICLLHGHWNHRWNRGFQAGLGPAAKRLSRLHSNALKDFHVKYDLQESTAP